MCLADLDLPFHTVEGVADVVLRKIRELAPSGPYFMVGYASAAAVAFDCAVQLLGQDERIGFFGLVDAEWPKNFARYNPQFLPIPVHFIETAGWKGSGVSPDIEHAWETATPDRARITLGEEASLCDVVLERLERSLTMTSAKIGFTPTVTIHRGVSNRSPVYCIPGAGDSVFQFLALASALGMDWPIHGLQPRGLEEQFIPHTTVEAAAQCYVSAIVSSGVRDAIHLIGHSFGGCVAFETAIRLEDAGVPIQSLTLIDSPASRDNISVREHTWSDVLVHWSELLELAAEGRDFRVDPLKIRSLSPNDALAYVHDRMIQCSLMPRRSNSNSLRGALRTFGAAVRANYRPRRIFEGRASYIFARHSLDTRSGDTQPQRVAFWQRHAPKLVVWEGPGNHITVLKAPHVERVASWWLLKHGMLDTQAAHHARNAAGTI